jgi:hypothetical protein
MWTVPEVGDTKSRQSLRKSKDLKHHNIQDLQTRQYTVFTRQYLETHQLRYYVVLGIYTLTYILTPRIGKDTSFIQIHVQNYTGCICIHKVHKDQVKDSFLV